MRIRSNPRRLVGRFGIPVLLVGATLAVSGCWGVVNPSNISSLRSVTVHKGISDIVIFNCTVERGSGIGRAHCVLDTIRSLCTGHRIPGLTQPECIGATDHGHAATMMDAIEDVASPNPDRQYDCLWVGIDKHDPFSNFTAWDGIKVGDRGCKT